MRSGFQSIFLVSVMVGALGLAFADSISNGVNGGYGFVLGFVGSFVFFSTMAVISDIGSAVTRVAAGDVVEEKVQEMLKAEEKHATKPLSQQSMQGHQE